MTRLLSVLVALLMLALPASALADHDTQYQWGEKESPILSPAMANVKMPTFVGGPCTGVARQAMPAGDGHDHLVTAQHDFKCGMEQVFFDSLEDELAARPGVITGEMDIKGNLMAIAVAYPESGFLLYDIADPAKPKFLSWYRGQECEQLLLDTDCGAYVDISPTLDRVYLSVQQTSVLPVPSASMRPAAFPGIEVVDISIPTLPISLQPMPVVSVGGVHTTKSFIVPEEGGDGPREPGEYLVSVANLMGLSIHQVLPTGNIVPLSDIAIGETHDTFIQDDPILGRTLLYAAGGFSSGFYVWDITAPSTPVPLGEWDPTPECGNDWYAHTIDVRVKDGKRILTMPNELIDFFGTQPDDACGTLAGNGDYTGGMWFVDITDLSKLAPFGNDDTHAPDEEIKAKSEPLLTSIYYNPALRAGGELTFSLHNQQIVGDKIYISQYHGGVVVVDAKEALEGKSVRPRELGIFVPSEGKGRPIPPDAGGVVQDGHFVTGFIDYRPLIWDTLYANGHVFIPDMTGGLTVARESGAPAAVPGAPVAGPACTDDRQAPLPRISRAKLTRRGVTLSGRASDRGCGRVANVAVAVARVTGKRCRFLSSLKRFARPRSCRRPIYLRAKGTGRWSYSLRTKLPRGRYVVMARATDTAGNRSRLVRRSARAR